MYLHYMYMTTARSKGKRVHYDSPMHRPYTNPSDPNPPGSISRTCCLKTFAIQFVFTRLRGKSEALTRGVICILNRL